MCVILGMAMDQGKVTFHARVVLTGRVLDRPAELCVSLISFITPLQDFFKFPATARVLWAHLHPLTNKSSFLV